MGIKGFSYFAQKFPQKFAHSHEQRVPMGSTIIVDFYSILFFLIEPKHTLKRKSPDKFLISDALGGDYNHIHSLMTDFIRILKSNEIDLIFVMDGSTGSNDSKMDEWKARQQENINKTKNFESMVNQFSAYIDFWTIPPLSSSQAQIAIEQAGCKLVRCKGEADIVCVKELIALGDRGFGILSTDTDFIVFKESKWIPLDFFKWESGIVIASVFTPLSFSRALDLHPSYLPKLAALCGNDFTKQILQTRGVFNTYSTIRSNIELLETHPNVNEISFVKDNPKLREAFDASMAFYNVLEMPVPKPPPSSFSTETRTRINSEAYRSVADESWILQGMTHGEMPAQLYTLLRLQRFFGMIRPEGLLDQTYATPSFDALHRPLRRYFYNFLGLKAVTELVRTKDGFVSDQRLVDVEYTIDFEENIMVKIYSGVQELTWFEIKNSIYMKESTITFKQIWTEDVSEATKKEIFLSFVNIHSPQSKANLWSAAKPGFFSICCLRYFLSLRSVSDAKILHSLIWTVLYCSARKWQSIDSQVLPTLQEIRASSGYISSIFYLRLISKTLRLNNLHTEPRLLFCGSTFRYMLLHGGQPPNPPIDLILAFSKLKLLVSQALVTNKFLSERYLSIKNFDCDLNSTDSFGMESFEHVLENIPLANNRSKYLVKTTSDLPIETYRNEIVKKINSCQVTCIEGETGCGKSSAVPMFIREDFVKQGKGANGDPLKIYVSQPRRIAAVQLAKRVACQSNTPLGDLVGYRISMESMFSPNTSIVYATTGFLLEFMSHHLEEFSTTTHLILDEVHERSVEMDLLLLIVKRELSKGAKFKLILMSATLQLNLYRDFFSLESLDSHQQIFINARKYPVDIIHLEDLFESVPSLFQQELLAKPVVENIASKMNGKHPIKPDISAELYTLGILIAISVARPGECVLVFLPGLEEITRMIERLEAVGTGYPISLIVLHSLSPKTEQDLAFDPPPHGKWKLILATNIAESSVTIPDVVYIIDYGLHRCLDYDGLRGIQKISLRWCSHASLKQRAGRAGRVAAGTVYRMITSNFMNTHMDEYSRPDIESVPLENTILRIKLTIPVDNVSSFLKEAIDPPTQDRIDDALHSLFAAKATSTNEEATAKITRFGRFAGQLPLDMISSKLIYIGYENDCIIESIIMAAVQAGDDIFKLPNDQFIRSRELYQKEILKNFDKRSAFDNKMYSELLMYLNVSLQWVDLNKKKRKEWASNNGISYTRMYKFMGSVLNVCGKVIRLLQKEINGENVRLILRKVGLIEQFCEYVNSERTCEISKYAKLNLSKLRFVIFASCSPLILRKASGSRISKHELQSSANAVRIAPLACTVNGEKTSVLGISKSVNDLATLFSVYGKVDNIEILDRNEIKVTYSPHILEKSRQTESILDDFNEALKRLMQMGRGRSPLHLPVPGLGRDVNKVFSCNVSNSALLSWKSDNPTLRNKKLVTNWRQPISFLRDQPNPYIFASGTSMLALGEGAIMSIQGMTLYPCGIETKLLVLIFSEVNSIKLYINRHNHEVAAFTSNLAMEKIYFQPYFMKQEDVLYAEYIHFKINESMSGLEALDSDKTQSSNMYKIYVELCEKVKRNRSSHKETLINVDQVDFSR